MRIVHNLAAINTTRLFKETTNKQSALAEKLSSGYSVNRAGDNAAGLSMSEKMRAQIRGLDKASRNAQDGISMIETADGALSEVHNIIQRMRELSVQASNGTSTDEDKSMIQNEIVELKGEIDRIANDTEFNNIKLLNGSLASQENMPLNQFLSQKHEGINIIYTDNDYETVQTPAGSATSTNSRYNTIKNILKTEIVPQAVAKIMRTFSPAFNYLSSSSIGIGLKLDSNPRSSVLASVGVSASGYANNFTLGYQLYVNTNGLLDADGNISEENRRKLEATVAHEFVHGMMDEALTCGMLGVNSNVQSNSNNKFPLWFVEGMAQTAAGGYANFNDFVNRGLQINSNSTTSEISSIVKGTNKLSNTSNGRSNYGTGYLACMYLGYLANGQNDISEQSISKGLSKILTDLIGGKSLDTVIKERTNNKYTSVSNFQSRFGDNESSQFIKDLTVRVGEGNGSLVSGNYNTDDILPDEPLSISLFQLDTTHDTVKNLYPSDVNVFSGGGKSVNGGEPVSGYSDGIQGSGSGDTPVPTPSNPDPSPVTPTPSTPPVEPDNPIEPGNKINLSNIKSIEGITYDRSSNTLTVNQSGDYVLTGSNSSNVKIVVQDGVQANITLQNSRVNTSRGEGIKLEGDSNLTLKLVGSNSITSTAVGKSAISVTGNAILNIEGEGKLTAKGGELAAAIGGDMGESAGNINISSGDITAIGGNSGAGIGGGLEGTGGNISITGGTIKSTGGSGAAGIGGGLSGAAGNIRIDGESAIVTAKSGGSGAEDIGAGARASASSGGVDIGNGVVSDGVNWTAHGRVVIRTRISVSGTFTGGDGSSIMIKNGGSISGSGTIKVEEGSTITIDNGGSVKGSTIDNKGNIDNHGTVSGRLTPDSINSIRSYVNKIINNIERGFRLNAGRTLQSSLPIPQIKVLCNGGSKTLRSSNTEIYDSNGNRVDNPSGVTLQEGDRFTYKVTFKLDDSSSEYFDNNSANSYISLAGANDMNQLSGTEISDDGKSITYTYELETNKAANGGEDKKKDSGEKDKDDIKNLKMVLQIGANSNQIIGINIDGIKVNDLGLSDISLESAEGAQNAIEACDKALRKVSKNRSQLGAYQNRLEHTISNLDNSSENLQQSESRIRDLDIAKGMAEYSKYQILSQVEQAMLSQANQTTSNILSLLRA